MLHFITPEVIFEVLESLDLAKSNRFFIALKETDFMGILEVDQDTFKLEELKPEGLVLTDILQPLIFKNEKDLRDSWKDQGGF